MEFKGTKGEWCVNGKKYPTIVSKNNNKNIIVTYSTIATVNSTFRTIEESQANAKLIADAGTTINKCGLMPSELLEHRNDLLEALIKLTSNAGLQKYVSDNKNTLLSESFNKAKQAIEKALK